jgi:hypothetical protein
VHQGDLALFRPMVQKLLNREQFHQQKINKSKTNIFGKLGFACSFIRKPLLNWI